MLLKKHQKNVEFIDKQEETTDNVPISV